MNDVTLIEYRGVPPSTGNGYIFIGSMFGDFPFELPLSTSDFWAKKFDTARVGKREYPGKNSIFSAEPKSPWLNAIFGQSVATIFGTLRDYRGPFDMRSINFKTLRGALRLIFQDPEREFGIHPNVSNTDQGHYVLKVTKPMAGLVDHIRRMPGFPIRHGILGQDLERFYYFLERIDWQMWSGTSVVSFPVQDVRRLQLQLNNDEDFKLWSLKNPQTAATLANYFSALYDVL
jgi:hypothetical protein